MPIKKNLKSKIKEKKIKIVMVYLNLQVLLLNL